MPGIMIDAVVEDPNQQLFYGVSYDPTVSGSRRANLGTLTAEVPAKLERRIIARRAAMELRPGASLNFGFGIPGGIFGVIAEQGIERDLWMSVEQGVHNGRMLDDRLFGAARNPDAIVPSIEQFDYYSGGGIDITFLGMGEADAAGNVNVSHLGGNLVGPGGFMEIAQNAKKVVFCGTFDAQGSQVRWNDGELTVINPGRIRKLVGNVERDHLLCRLCPSTPARSNLHNRAGGLPFGCRWRTPHRARSRHRHRARHPSVYGVQTADRRREAHASFSVLMISAAALTAISHPGIYNRQISNSRS